MQPHIAHARRQKRRGRHRPHVLGLVDVAESHTVIDECPDRLLSHPTAVPHLRNQRKFPERPAEPDEKFAVLRSETERPRELHQHRPQLLRPQHRPQPVLESGDLAVLENPRMRKSLMQFGSKLKARIALDLPHPKPYNFRLKWLIKRAVYFDNVEVSGELLQRVQAPVLRLRINQTVPMRVRPAGGSDAGGGGHDALLYSLYVRLIMIANKWRRCQGKDGSR